MMPNKLPWHLKQSGSNYPIDVPSAGTPETGQ